MDRPLLIVDLDETLMQARETPLERPADFCIGPYFAYRRPHLAPFLERVAARFDLAVWTSSSPDYAQEATRHLFSQGLPLAFVWTSERCTLRLNPHTLEPYWVKDLGKVKRRGYALERVLVLDDLAEKLERHYGNWVPISAFEGDPEDTALLEVLPLLERLSRLENVRRVEKRTWRRGR